MIWLVCLLATGLITISVSAIVISYLIQLRWMRMFCVERSIPLASMDNKPEPKRESVPPRERHVVSVPVPGADWMRKGVK